MMEHAEIVIVLEFSPKAALQSSVRVSSSQHNMADTDRFHCNAKENHSQNPQ